MALAMTRPTRRDDSSLFQYKRRTPKQLLANRRGQRIAFRLPHAEGGEAVAETTVGAVIKLSLRTRDPHVAKLRCAAVSEQIERLLRAAMAPPQRLTQKKIAAIAGELYKAEIQHFEDEPGPASMWWYLHEGTAGLHTNNIQELERVLGPDIDRVLDAKGITVDAETRRRLLQAVCAAFTQSSHLLLNRANGDYSADCNAKRFPEWPDSVGPSITITGLFEGWRLEAERLGRTSATISKYDTVTTAFVVFLDHDDASKVTRQDVLRYKDHRLVELKRSPKTVKDGDLAALNTIFGWGKENGRLPENCAAGISLRAPQTKRKGYSDGAALALLRAAAAYVPRPNESPKMAAAKRWAFLLCAFSGARVGEIAQLRRQDVKQDPSGVWIMELKPEAGTLKGKNKDARVVPLHPQIIEQGFLRFIQAAPAGYLFFDATGPHNFEAPWRTYKNRIGDFARSVVREAGVPANHGWRHRFITICRRHNVDLEKRRMITGHVGQGTDEEVYGEPDGLLEEIKKLPRYDLPHPDPQN